MFFDEIKLQQQIGDLRRTNQEDRYFNLQNKLSSSSNSVDSNKLKLKSKFDRNIASEFENQLEKSKNNNILINTANEEEVTDKNKSEPLSSSPQQDDDKKQTTIFVLNKLPAFNHQQQQQPRSADGLELNLPFIKSKRKQQAPTNYHALIGSLVLLFSTIFLSNSSSNSLVAKAASISLPAAATVQPIWLNNGLINLDEEAAENPSLDSSLSSLPTEQQELINRPYYDQLEPNNNNLDDIALLLQHLKDSGRQQQQQQQDGKDADDEQQVAPASAFQRARLLSNIVGNIPPPATNSDLPPTTAIASDPNEFLWIQRRRLNRDRALEPAPWLREQPMRRNSQPARMPLEELFEAIEVNNNNNNENGDDDGGGDGNLNSSSGEKEILSEDNLPPPLPLQPKVFVEELKKELKIRLNPNDDIQLADDDVEEGKKEKRRQVNGRQFGSIGGSNGNEVNLEDDLKERIGFESAGIIVVGKKPIGQYMVTSLEKKTSYPKSAAESANSALPISFLKKKQQEDSSLNQLGAGDDDNDDDGDEQQQLSFVKSALADWLAKIPTTTTEERVVAMKEEEEEDGGAPEEPMLMNDLIMKRSARRRSAQQLDLLSEQAEEVNPNNNNHEQVSLDLRGFLKSLDLMEHYDQFDDKQQGPRRPNNWFNNQLIALVLTKLKSQLEDELNIPRASILGLYPLNDEKLLVKLDVGKLNRNQLFEMMENFEFARGFIVVNWPEGSKQNPVPLLAAILRLWALNEQAAAANSSFGENQASINSAKRDEEKRGAGEETSDEGSNQSSSLEAASQLQNPNSFLDQEESMQSSSARLDELDLETYREGAEEQDDEGMPINSEESGFISIKPTRSLSVENTDNFRVPIAASRFVRETTNRRRGANSGPEIFIESTRKQQELIGSRPKFGGRLALDDYLINYGTKSMGQRQNENQLLNTIGNDRFLLNRLLAAYVEQAIYNKHKSQLISGSSSRGEQDNNGLLEANLIGIEVPDSRVLLTEPIITRPAELGKPAAPEPQTNIRQTNSDFWWSPLNGHFIWTFHLMLIVVSILGAYLIYRLLIKNSERNKQFLKNKFSNANSSFKKSLLGKSSGRVITGKVNEENKRHNLNNEANLDRDSCDSQSINSIECESSASQTNSLDLLTQRLINLLRQAPKATAAAENTTVVNLPPTTTAAAASGNKTELDEISTQVNAEDEDLELDVDDSNGRFRSSRSYIKSLINVLANARSHIPINTKTFYQQQENEHDSCLANDNDTDGGESLINRQNSTTSSTKSQQSSSSSSHQPEEPGIVMSQMDISAAHLILSYMEKHLEDKQRLRREWLELNYGSKSSSASSNSTTKYSNLYTNKGSEEHKKMRNLMLQRLAKVALSEENKRKNVNHWFVPFDRNRVRLSCGGNNNSNNNSMQRSAGWQNKNKENNNNNNNKRNQQPGHSDYINASYIYDDDPRRPTHIITQGPLQHTAGQFWQMIWEQGISVVVMLTRLNEESGRMCHCYWPTNNNSAPPQAPSSNDNNDDGAGQPAETGGGAAAAEPAPAASLADSAPPPPTGRRGSVTSVFNNLTTAALSSTSNSTSTSTAGTANKSTNANNQAIIATSNEDRGNNVLVFEINTSNEGSLDEEDESAGLNVDDDDDKKRLVKNKNNHSNNNKQPAMRFEIHLVSEHVSSNDYLIRNLCLINRSTGETRTITQFHYLAWPESGQPENPKSLLQFRRKIHKSYRDLKSPILVHCSDGAGRSGTYVLLDIILERIKNGAKEIDPFATLEHLRDQRAGLCATLSQFEFVLVALAEEIQIVLNALPH